MCFTLFSFCEIWFFVSVHPSSFLPSPPPQPCCFMLFIQNTRLHKFTFPPKLPGSSFLSLETPALPTAAYRCLCSDLRDETASEVIFIMASADALGM
jgi:hypothetical protein